MKNRAMWLITIIVMMFGLSPMTVGAVTLSNNLSSTADHWEPTPATADTWLASSFGTGPESRFLGSVTLLLRQDPSAPAGGSAGQVEIYQNSGGEPGTSLGILNPSPASIGTQGLYSFTPSGLLSLDPNSTYWVVLKTLVGNLQWAWTDSNVGDGIGFQHTWGAGDLVGGDRSWFIQPTNPFIMSVTAIPEPSTLALFGAALLLLGLGYCRHVANIA